MTDAYLRIFRAKHGHIYWFNKFIRVGVLPIEVVLAWNENEKINWRKRKERCPILLGNGSKPTNI